MIKTIILIGLFFIVSINICLSVNIFIKAMKLKGDKLIDKVEKLNAIMPSIFFINHATITLVLMVFIGCLL